MHTVNLDSANMLRELIWFQIGLQVFELEPGLYKDCHDFVMNKMHGRFEVLAHSLYVDGDTHVDQYNDHDDMPAPLPTNTPESVLELNDKLKKQTISSATKPTEVQQPKQNKCNTCDASFEDVKLYREHHKSEWHKHNMKRKTRQLPPLTEEECTADIDLFESKSDLKDYSFWVVHDKHRILSCTVIAFV